MQEKAYSLICSESKENGKDSNTKKDKEKKPNGKEGEAESEVHKTEAESVNNEEEVTTSNMGRAYELSTSEIFFMSQQDRISMNLTCVGSVKVKGATTTDIIQTMMDICSSDSWIVTSHAKRLGAKQTGFFNGLVKTISGHKRAKLPKYEVKILKDNKNWVSIICLGVNEIGWKPSIESVRFERLCKEFSVNASDVDNGGGQI